MDEKLVGIDAFEELDAAALCGIDGGGWVAIGVAVGIFVFTLAEKAGAKMRAAGW